MIVNRRTFLKQTTAGACACLGASAGLTSCTSYVFASYVLEDGRLAVNKIDFGESNYVLVRVEQFAEAIFISKDDQGNYSAFLTKCTHKGCEVRPTANILLCPCHGSEYDYSGNVLEGPAEENLIPFKVVTDEEKIYVS